MKKRAPTTDIFFTPGPGMTYGWLWKEMKSNQVNHRTIKFKILIDEVRERMRVLFGAPNAEVVFIRGGGNEAMTLISANYVRKNRRTLIIKTGTFGELWQEISSREDDNKIIDCRSNWGYTYDEETVRLHLKANNVGLILMQLGETSTGVYGDPFPIARARDELAPQALLAGDAVLEAGASPIKMDAMGLDLIAGAGQKVFSLPSGLGFVILNTRAIEELRKKRISYTLDLDEELAAWRTGDARHTPATMHLVGLRAMLEYILERKGEHKWYHEHVMRARYIRESLQNLGFRSLTISAATNAVSVLRVPPGKNAQDVVEILESLHLVVGVGMRKKDNALRIAHFAGTSRWNRYLVETLKDII